jgi:hypothetical protein
VIVIAVATPAAIHQLFLTLSDRSTFSIINTILGLVF